MRAKRSRTLTVRASSRRIITEALEGRRLLSAAPTITAVTPAANSTGVALEPTVTATLNLPNGAVNPLTAINSSVYLYQTAYPNNNEKFIPANVKLINGGTQISMTPLADLLPNISYTFAVNAGLMDVNGDAFTPFTSTFTTGNFIPAVSQTAAFNEVSLPTAQGYEFTDIQIGPDGKLYGSTNDGRILRYSINADGTLSTPLIVTSLQTAYGGNRLVTGFAFDPSFVADPTKPMLWVSNTFYALSGATNGPNFTSSLTVMSGANLGTVKDAIIDLPRSVADHVNDVPVFQPGTHNLFFCQGGLNAFGAPDATWGNRSETLLSSAVLKVNTSALNLNGPALNVLTADARNDSGVLLGGTYDPNAAGAPLTIYATGIRNAFSIMFDDRGQLWAPMNGSSPGGNTPAGGGVPALTDVQQVETDILVKVRQGGYYGHPDPVRNQFVLDQGNPSTGAIPSLAYPAYPSGTNPDPNYQLPNYLFGLHSSPDSMIEYHGGAFGGALDGKFLVAEYSAPDDIQVLSRDASDNVIGGLASTATGPLPDRLISGFTHLEDPLSLVEDPTTGSIYISEYGSSKLSLWAPSSIPAQISTSSNVVAFNTIAAGNAGAGPSRVESVTITNTGANPLTFGANAVTIIDDPAAPGAGSDFKIINAGSLLTALANQASMTIQLQYTGSAVGLQSALLQVATNDPATPTLDINLHGIGTVGLYGSLEPSLVQVLCANDIPTIVGAGPNDVNINVTAYPQIPDPSSQELPMQSMIAASSGPVTISPIASFSASHQPVSQIGYYTPGNTSSKTALFTIAQADAQTVSPTAVGTISFSPGNTPFSLFAYFPGVMTADGSPDYHYSQDVLNTLDMANPRKFRFFPYETASGTIVPNTFVMAVEDYNGATYNSFVNFVGIISNVIAAPAVPTMLTASSASGNRVVLTWGAPFGAASYSVQREDPGSSTFATIATGLTTPTFTDVNVAAGATYMYQVQATNIAGSSAFTGAVQAEFAPAAPANLGLAGAPTSSVGLSWDPSSGATGYSVFREDPGSSNFLMVATALATPAFTDINVTAGQTYQYEVQAENTAGTSPDSAVFSATLAPAAPVNLQIASVTPTTVSFTWDATGGAASYSIDRKDPNSSAFAQIAAGVSGASYDDSTVVGPQTYQYEVVAQNAGGMSPASSRIAADVPPPLQTLAITVGKGANKAVQYTNAAGTLVTIKLTGSGTATVDFSAVTLSQSMNKSGVVVSGANAIITGITTNGTSAGNSVLIVLTKGGGNSTTLGGVSTDGPLNSIKAPTTTLTGVLAVAGSVGRISLASASAATITASKIGSIVITGAITNTIIDTTGSIGSISAGSLDASEIYAGAGVNGATPFPPVASAFPSVATIGSVKLKKTGGIDSFINSSIAASKIQTLSLGTVRFSNNGKAFGVEAALVGRLTAVDSSTNQSFLLARLNSAAVLAADLAAKKITPVDFAIDIV